VRFSIWKPCRSNFKCNVQGFVTFAWKNGFLQHAENCINTSVFAVGVVQKHCKYRGILPLRTDTNFFSSRRPARITAIINNSNDNKHFSLDSFLLFFLRCYCGDAFYSDTFLQTDDVTHKSLYTEQLLCADTLTQGGLCTDKLYTQTSLRSEAFIQRIFYTKNFLHTDTLHKETLRAHTPLHTDGFTHRIFTHTTFYTEKPLYRTGSTQFFLIQRL
jgi:hypothetical protein